MLQLRLVLLCLTLQLNIESYNSKRLIMYLIEGNIGAGKSTFLELIQAHWPHIEVAFEPVNAWQKEEHGQSLLQNFYTNPQRWAYSMESFTLINRIIDNNRQQTTSRTITLAERSIYSGFHCFAKNSFLNQYMSPIEWNIYKQWFDFLTKHSDFRKPKGFIYLRTSPEVAYQRIIKRSRSAENLISLDYVTQIHLRHEELLLSATISDLPVLVLDANLEFNSNSQVLTDMFLKLEQFLKQNGQTHPTHQSIEIQV